jgi:hypothetical protein
MSFGNRADKCKTIHNYSQALMFFTRYPKPRSSKWSDNERPIYISNGKPSTRMYQYRMAAGPTDTTTSTPAYFDLVLHSTSVIRYMAPTEDNKRVVYLTYGGWPSVQTRAFMLEHGWYYAKAYTTTDNTRVAVPLNPRAKSAHWVAGQWIAKLTFNEDDKLIVPESDHMTVYRRKSSSDDKSVRADMRRKMDLMHDMLWFSIEGMLEALADGIAKQSMSPYWLKREFGPFTTALRKLSRENSEQIINSEAEFLRADVDFTPDTIEAMRALYMCAFRHLYGKNLADGTETLPTQDAVQRSVTNYLMSMFRIKDGKEFVPLPKFMLESEFPRRHFTRPE